MTFYSIPSETPPDPWEGAPTYVRAAALRKARAWRVLGIYKRRSWNPQAAMTEYSRASEELDRALDRWEHQEMNPSLF